MFCLQCGGLDTDDALAFSVLENIRPMIETVPLEQAADVYARMIEGEDGFAWCWLQGRRGSWAYGFFRVLIDPPRSVL